MGIKKKFNIQEAKYEFPYHYIPYFKKNETPTLLRKLRWGLEYLCYQNHIIDKVVSLKPNSVLDVGCGDGYLVGHLPKIIPVRVGTDLSSKAIAFAKAFHNDCTFYAQDADNIEMKFDVVTAIEVLEHIPESEISNIFQILEKRTNDEGKIIISVPTIVIPPNKKHYRHYTIELFKEQLVKSETNLKIAEVEYIYSQPWWFILIRRLLENRFFSLEINSIMRLAWKSIWNKHRIADSESGFHLVVVLEKNQ